MCIIFLLFYFDSFMLQILRLALLFVPVAAVTHFQDQPKQCMCMRVHVCVPGWVFDCSLSCEDADKDPNIKVDADGQQGLDVSLVHSCPLVQTVEDDTQSL